MLTRASRAARQATKLAELMPGLDGLGTSLPQAENPHGTEGRLLRLPAPRAKVKQVQGPRQHGPRLSQPSF
jgi:hypothetical protein